MRRLLIFSVVLLSACGTIQPRIGMSFNELNQQTRGVLHGGAGCGGLEMVGAQGDMAIYHVRRSTTGNQMSGCNPNIFYYFQNDQLVKIDQGELYEQRYKVDINR